MRQSNHTVGKAGARFPLKRSNEFKTTDGNVIESRGILPLNRRVEKPVEAAQTVRQRSLQQLKAGYALVVQRNDLTIENG